MENQNWLPIESYNLPDGDGAWLYNANKNFVALGCRVWVEGDYFWAVSNGTMYTEDDKIVLECELDDDYEFTHFVPVPTLPKMKVKDDSKDLRDDMVW
jgi:hypothetical protein